MQGEVLSPIFFSFYVNDCEVSFIKDGCIPVQCRELSLFLLMYADAMVIFSESIVGLQQMLDSLYTYTRKWSLCVNTDKTKILIIRNRGEIKSDEKWNYGDCNLEIINSFCYLGLMLYYNGNFNGTQKQLSSQGLKAMYSLLSNTKKYHLNVFTNLSLFDTYVNSVLSYACEIWGHHPAPDIEKIHVKYCKRLLSVKNSTNSALVYMETGRLPLSTYRRIRMFKYWFKLLSTDNCILKSMYNVLLTACESGRNFKLNWVNFIKTELNALGLGYMWSFQDQLSINTCLPIIVQQITDAAKQNVLSNLESSRCFLYRHLVDNHDLQYYLTKNMEPRFQKCISKIRMSSHMLEVEKGRHFKIPHSKRICRLCKKLIEDEFHFILVCPSYCNLRKKVH